MNTFPRPENDSTWSCPKGPRPEYHNDHHTRTRDFDAAAADAYVYGPQQQQQHDAPSWSSLESHALYSVCLVSKHLRDVARPIPYHGFMPGYGNSWRSSRYTWEGRLTSLMRTVAERCGLAAQVRILHARFDLIKTLSNKEALLAFEHAMHVLGMHQAGGWRLRLADGAEPRRLYSNHECEKTATMPIS
ncbi:hypothetical protein G7054_g2207 [Neopestalotiopsis clavispora]|nr:hypothetical protein G7054_g2207 [Neopestalotiopsis clavispora]